MEEKNSFSLITKQAILVTVKLVVYFNIFWLNFLSLVFIFNWRIVPYHIVLISANSVNQLCLYPLPREPPSTSPPQPRRSSRSPALSSLCYRRPPSAVRMAACPAFSFSCCASKSTLYSCPARRFISTVFLDSIFW